MNAESTEFTLVTENRVQEAMERLVREPYKEIYQLRQFSRLWLRAHDQVNPAYLDENRQRYRGSQLRLLWIHFDRQVAGPCKSQNDIDTDRCSECTV